MVSGGRLSLRPGALFRWHQNPRQCSPRRHGARWYWEAKRHLTALFAEEHPAFPTETAPAESLPAPAQLEPGLAQLVEKYDGTRLSGRRRATCQRVADSKVSPTDPDANPMSRFQGDRAKLGYHTHYVVDGGKARIILAALSTPASIMDNMPMLDLVRWARFRWKLHPQIGVGDTKYGTIEDRKSTRL